MDFKQLQYILAIYEEGGISKAAEKLFISQPSLSKCVISLEKQLGMKIFDRSVVPIELTPFGKAYIETAQQILNLNDDLIRRISDIKNVDTGLLRIGTTFTGATQKLPYILPKFIEEHPNIKMEIIEESTSLLEETLVKGNLDLILLNGPIENKKIKFMPINQEKLYLVTPPGYFNLHDKEKTFENINRKYNLNEEEFIIQHQGQKMRKLTEEIFEDYELEPKIKFEMRNINAIIKLCAEGVGLAIVNESIKENMNYHIVPDFYYLPKRYDIQAGVGYRKDGYTSEAAKKFLEIIKGIKNSDRAASI